MLIGVGTECNNDNRINDNSLPNNQNLRFNLNW